ncbi:endoplasmic reticulum-Golgi intermediate compartment protein [Thraustotheca clavata]|uniref:Endoplasmic reticulum-Golgi intermediate compartment protein n=1 Tax=Thraustotheca clavata TaxID=74557 RepID=A0A1V9YUE7_9STRA|nr:endoplasmic reticulum-Golgi intermediate compartment protein [Thraustotheca clavata]
MLRQRHVVKDDENEADKSFSTRRILKKVDVYPKLHREFKVQTEAGATVSIVTMVIMVTLFLSELSHYLTPNRHEHMVVDTTTNEKLLIAFDISYPALNCREAHMNSMDVAGELQVNMHHTVFKTRLAADGTPIGKAISHVPNAQEVEETLPPNYCGSCYDAKHPAGLECCNTCDHVKEAFIHSDKSLEEADKTEQCIREAGKEESESQDGEGCRLNGTMSVNRVAGNFHVALGRTFHRQGRLVHQFIPGQQYNYNASHIVHKLYFGNPFPGQSNPLDGVTKIADQAGAVYQYYIKIVPTIYDDGYGSVQSNQYSFTQQTRYLNPYGQMTVLPGVFFIFDISPFMVQMDVASVPFTHFLMRICAIIGGMISIAGFIDSFLYHYGNAPKIV